MKNLLFIICILIYFPAIAQIPTSGLVGNYLFNNNTFDSSGKDNNATAFGGVFVDDRFGNPLSAIHMNDISDSVLIPIPDATFDNNSSVVKA